MVTYSIIEESSNFQRNQHRLNFVQNEIAQFDQDTIGLVTFKNYFTNVYGRELFEKLNDLSTQSGISGSDDEMDLIYRFEHNRWKFISSNKDTMDHMGFYKFVFPNEFDDVNSNDALFVFRLYDLNSDGQWTFDEYIKAIDLHSGHLLINDFKYIVDKGKRRFTRSIDLDGNKFIDLKEFKNWNMPSLQQNINADLERIYAKCDADKDGRLTESEVKQNFEFFQVFEFTNYGDDYRTHQTNNHNEL
jgi:Ca2+-binding EF-hand superfamily protein